jgi:hypothetical protein
MPSSGYPFDSPARLTGPIVPQRAIKMTLTEVARVDPQRDCSRQVSMDLFLEGDHGHEIRRLDT